MKQKFRAQTGIKGFDKIIEGGFPRGSEILISGRAGTGKTIFSLEFVYRSAKEFNEKSIYFTFEEKKEALIEQARQFGWDLEALEKKKKLKIITYGTDDISMTTVNDIMEIIENFGAKRIVIDSLTNLVNLMPSKNHESKILGNDIQRFLHKFIDTLKEQKDVIKFLIAQERKDEVSIATEYLCDGIVSFKFESMGTDFDRSITISKMRRTKLKKEYFPVEISDNGIIVHKLSEFYEEQNQFE